MKPCVPNVRNEVRWRYKGTENEEEMKKKKKGRPDLMLIRKLRLGLKPFINNPLP